MATRKEGLSGNFVAGQAFTASHQYCAVKMDSAGSATDLQVDLCGAGGRAIGFYQGGAAAAGEAVSVVYSGQTKAKAGGTVTAGAYLKSDASGQVVATTTDTDEVVALAITGGASGEFIEVLVLHGRYAG